MKITKCVLIALTIIGGKTLFAQQGNWGTISGRIVVEGSAPVLPDLIAKGDPNVKNANICALKAIPDEKLVVGKEGGLANCFIFLNNRRMKLEIHPDLKKPKPVKIRSEQKGCRFIPHAIVVRTNQKIHCVSMDAHTHNIHTFAVRNNPFNILIAPNDQKGIELEFKKAEPIPLEVKCDIHPWMSARWFIVDHPYAVLTDNKGYFTIKLVPAGVRLKLRIWHEIPGYIKTNGQRDIEVNVPSGGVADLGVIKIPASRLK